MSANVTSLLRSLSVVVTQVGIDGKPKAEHLVRPLRVFTDGSGFAVKLSGKAIACTPTGANAVTVLLANSRRPETDTRVACLADLGIAKAAKAPTTPANVPVQAAAKAKPALTTAQEAALAQGRAKLAAKRNAPIAKASPKAEAPAVERSVATIGDLMLAKFSQAEVLQLVEHLIRRS